jgi:hypothetical protein
MSSGIYDMNLSISNFYISSGIINSAPIFVCYSHGAPIDYANGLGVPKVEINSTNQVITSLILLFFGLMNLHIFTM